MATHLVNRSSIDATRPHQNSQQQQQQLQQQQQQQQQNNGYQLNDVQFDELKTKLLMNGSLFEDESFPADESCLFQSRTLVNTAVVSWLRPQQVATNPVFFRPLPSEVEPQPYRVRLGVHGDLWLLGAFACLYENLPVFQCFLGAAENGLFSSENRHYTGLLRFRFWHGGNWREIIIDDRIPFLRDGPFGLHSTTSQEFWPCLIEKAYAKLHGSYESTKDLNLSDALRTITGGVVETFTFSGQFTDIPRNIINVMFKSIERQSLLVCAIYGPASTAPRNAIESKRLSAVSGEQILPNGLVRGNFYTVTDMREIRLITDAGEIPIVLNRLRNPTGEKVWFNGAFSDKSPEWLSIPEEDRRQMGLVCRDDGEFWMEFRDFLDTFDILTICHFADIGAKRPPALVRNTLLDDQFPLTSPPPGLNELIQNPSPVYSFEGAWTPLTAGGRAFCRDTHWMNPQYRVSLRCCDEDEENGTDCTLVVELVQHNRDGSKKQPIGFYLYKCVSEFNTLPLVQAYFEKFNYVASTEHLANTTSVCRRFLLPAADYVLVPCCYEPGVEAEFSLRVLLDRVENTVTPVDSVTDLSQAWLPRLLVDVGRTDSAAADEALQRSAEVGSFAQQLRSSGGFFHLSRGAATVDSKALLKLSQVELHKHLVDSKRATEPRFITDQLTESLCNGIASLSDPAATSTDWLLSSDPQFDIWCCSFVLCALAEWASVYLSLARKSTSRTTLPVYQLRSALHFMNISLSNESLHALASAVIGGESSDSRSVSFLHFATVLVKLFRAWRFRQSVGAVASPTSHGYLSIDQWMCAALRV